ncbi:hypothetical protein [Segniliparus rotundus]|nr:hypothetical protein [Segniliparus rotundus]
MRNAKLPLLFVVAVVGVLILGAVCLVALSGRGGIAVAPTAGQGADSQPAPTGSSIAAALAGPPPPWAGKPTTAPRNSSSSPPPSRPSPASSAVPAVQGPPMTVSYSVTGSGPASILTYWRGDHDIATEHDAPLPWSRTVTLNEQSSIRLSAQVGAGDAHCQISVDGQLPPKRPGLIS